MLKIPELAVNNSHKVITVCNGEKLNWADREQAEDYFLEAMMSAKDEEYDRYAGIYIQLRNGLSYCTDK